MFLSKHDIAKKVNDIIFDDQDNDIIFLVANKGIGKTKLLNEIYDTEVCNDNILIVDGTRIHCSSSILCKCFIDGICAYLEKQDTLDRIIALCDLLAITPPDDLITDNGTLNIGKITALLYKKAPDNLKDIYALLAGKTPLLIIACAITLNPVDIDYLLNLQFDTWGSRITFIIALRATPDCIKNIELISKKNENRVWVFPLLPEITKVSQRNNPESVAAISIDKIGDSRKNNFTEAILSNNVYLDTYNLVERLLVSDFSPSHLFLLANQEMRICDEKYLQSIVRQLYHTELPEYDDRLILPHDGKLLWMDALSYYLTLYNDKGMHKALLATQDFFFDIITNADLFLYGKPERKAFSSILNEAANNKENSLADGFSLYFSKFASLTKALSIHKRNQAITADISEFSMNILDRVVLELTDSCMSTLCFIHDKTQICSILDIGLDTIVESVNGMLPSEELSQSTIQGIIEYCQKCNDVAGRWHDLTLSQKVTTLGEALLKIGIDITKAANIKSTPINNPYNEANSTHCDSKTEDDLEQNTEEDLCHDIEKALTTIQQDKNNYKLNEDCLNDKLRDLLRMKYTHLRDQSRHGIAGSGTDVGRVDLLLCDNSDIPYSIIESLKLHSLKKKYLTDHICKAIINYNPLGCSIVFIIIYSYIKDFDSFWTKTITYLSTCTYPFEIFSHIKDFQISRTESRHASIIFKKSGKPVSLHIYAINLYDDQQDN